MAKNDCNVPDQAQQFMRDEQRAKFKQMQQELEALRAAESSRRIEEEKHHRRIEAANHARHLKALAAEKKLVESELALMAKEDSYYVEKIARVKRQIDEESKRAKSIDPIKEQQMRIEKMRQNEAEKKQQEDETKLMRIEDSLSRQRRFKEMEIQQFERQRERKARKEMETLERETKSYWKVLDEQQSKLAAEQKRLQRGEERRRMRLQAQQQREAEQTAWTTCTDGYGNVYYYNTLTGVSQWTNPFAH
ncbi:hypothetical protein PINS_up001532 [Pythium insidiosum]|nr:hypothetical protein PINS_up001532 [Pythium insidiosum]